MEELELLKKDWNSKFDDYKNYSEQDIFKMIKGKSFSIARILLIIGLLEICFWMFFNYLDISKNESFFSVEYILRTVLFVVFMGTLIYSFMVIKNESNAKKLMQQILNLRKIILIYIILTFILILIFGILDVSHNAADSLRGFVNGWNSANEKRMKPLLQSDLGNIFGYFLYFTTFSLGIIILYFLYKRIYGRLLDRLKANYKELSKIEIN
ncbi:hypothetical protein SAMN05421847_2889 [Halpernia humi]|uniref:Uncharacterized protein n=1 Tax=Halpernia humi TaxID=493375 RepID=A0A1H6BI51_9FLAO|nr:hypothetical protein [Halpernia humi]SEG60047.1 hypothetical protein SAMN05421847_2889 [Halpernia humi]